MQMTDYEKDARCLAAIEEIKATMLTYRTWPDVERLLKRAFAEGWNALYESIEEELQSER
jgi:hypothetical protein